MKLTGTPPFTPLRDRWQRKFGGWPTRVLTRASREQVEPSSDRPSRGTHGSPFAGPALPYWPPNDVMRTSRSVSPRVATVVRGCTPSAESIGARHLLFAALVEGHVMRHSAACIPVGPLHPPQPITTSFKNCMDYPLIEWPGTVHPRTSAAAVHHYACPRALSPTRTCTCTLDLNRYRKLKPRTWHVRCQNM